MTITRKLSPIIGYHGCDREIAEKVLAGEEHLNASKNSYDWLGSGIYFWVDSFARAMDWAESTTRSLNEPYVVGAFLDPGHCLDLTDYGVVPQIKLAYDEFVKNCRVAGVSLPSNKVPKEGSSLVRNLDCAVINFLHGFRASIGEPEFETVYGVFEEGPAIFENSALREKTHIQIAVRTNQMIKGYFRPQELCQYNR